MTDGFSSRPDDEGRGQTMLVWNGVVARVPALVVRPRSAQDVAAAVGFARDHGLLLDVRAGHDVGSAAERAVTLDLSGMSDVVVDHDARLAHVGPGCLLEEVDRAAQDHGLELVADPTRADGIGALMRRSGWAPDDLEEVELVTRDGLIRSAGRAENAHLFRAFTDGDGDVGVVTRLTLRLRDRVFR